MKKPLISLVLALFIPLFSGCSKNYKHAYVDRTKIITEIKNTEEKPRLLVNLDGDHWNNYLNKLSKKEDLNDNDVKELVSWYTNTDITDLMFNIFDQCSNTKTDVMTFRGDMYKNGVQGSNIKDYSFFEWNYKIIEEKGIDAFELWFNECRNNNINPWITIRMNDCHGSEDADSIFRGDLFFKAKQNEWMLGKNYGHQRICLNYEIKEVRDYFLNYIKEQITHYDVYGLELDFLREIYCFDYIQSDNEKIVGIMNGFISEVNDIRKEAEDKWGHEIKLTARMCRDIEQAYVFGFDVKTWDKQNLVDSITMTPRGESCDSAMPLAYWKEQLPNTEIYAGIETNVLKSDGISHATAEVVNAYAAQYLTAGADGIYLFNYYKTSPTGKRSDEVFSSFKSIGDVLNSNRRHIVTYQDTTPKDYEPYSPLPIKLKFNKKVSLDIETGLIPENRKVAVIIGTDSKKISKFRVNLNNSELSYVGETKIHGSSGGDLTTEDAYAPVGTNLYLFECSLTKFENNVQKLGFVSTHLFAKHITYIELSIAS